MSCSLSAGSARLVALTALAGTTVLAGPLVTAPPAVAAPVAIEGYATGIPADAPTTGPEHYFTPVPLSNGDTAYGINEEQPLAPLGEHRHDDEDYAPAVPFDDPDSDRVDVVGERVGDHSVYWEPENAALAGYVLSVFGASENTDETLAVHWAVRSLSTAAAPSPELSGLEESHLDRAATMIRSAREDIASLTPQDSYGTEVSLGSDGQPETLRVQLPEIYSATTVTLSGPVTFADGTTTRTITGGDRDQHLELAVPGGISRGEVSATVTATMPTTELILLPSDEHRDLFIGGQDRAVTWSVSAGFRIDEATSPSGGTPAEEAGAPDSGGADDAAVDNTPVGNTPVGNTADGDTAVENTAVENTAGDDDAVDRTAVNNTTNGTAEIDAGGNGGGTVQPGPRGHSGDDGLTVPVIVPEVEARQEVNALLDAYVLFEDNTSTTTEVVTETVVSGGAATDGYDSGYDDAYDYTDAYGFGYADTYADMVMANTGTGAPRAVGSGATLAPALLAGIVVAAGLGSWMLRRRKPVAPTASRG